MKTLIIYFSDVHLTGKKPENEGAVITAFCEDVKKQLMSLQYTDVYVLIGGDLVQAADNATCYQTFYDKILSKLISYGISKEKIICVPGNHDCQRQWVIDNKEIYAPIVNQLYSEDRFNNMIKTQQVVLFTEKFANYRHFIEKYLPNPRYNLIGFSMEINDDWSLYCLNSALTSFAGYEWSEYPQLQYDERKLNVETRNINDWVQNNTKKKILMMHHPLPYLVEWADDELTKLLRTKFDLLLTGHTHRQNILCNQIKGETYVWCQAPQLYTDKTDKLGYCIIEIDNDYVERIIYREWFESRKCFKKGLDFTDGDDGIVEIDNNGPLIKDPIRLMFEERFRDTMAIYGDESLVWIDRYFSVNRFDRSFTFNQKNLYSEDDLIESKKSFKIVTPAQYGLTSFGWHFLLKLWKEKKIFGLFLDCRSIKINKLDRNIERQLSVYGTRKENVGWIVFDNWDLNNKDAKQILTYMKEEFESVPLLILCPMLEKSFVDNENISLFEFSIDTLFMAPMQLSQLRNIVSVYNRKHRIGEEEVVLKRLNDDIQNFNMHRTPLNCISLLEVFSNSFEDNPVNRTEMIERLLRIIFENEEVPNYKSLPDVKDCEFAIGYYCEQMIRNEQYYFGSKHFYDKIFDFCKNQKITLDINYLFSILLRNQIICQYDNDIFGFRFAFWVYYFAAMRMTKSQDFANFILKDENYVHYPEILEFYTGSDRTKNDAAQVVINDLFKVTEKVHDKVGLPDKMNPLQQLRLEITDEQATKAIEKLDVDLKKTKLPTNIKDALDDSTYNPSKPFHQDVRKIWESYSVNYLQEMIGIASKVLRNSDYILPENKVKLLDTITEAWLNTIRVVYLMVPALAMDGKAGYDDFRLHLDDTFNKESVDKKRLLIDVMSAIPYNIIMWYKDNIYSSKLADLLYEKIENETNLVIKHVLVNLIVYEQPEHWENVVRRYLEKIDKRSFYFGDTLSSLRMMYSKGAMSSVNLAKTKNLIFLAYTKLASSNNKMNPSMIRDIKPSILPQRDSDKED
ncbi:MAG: metallophosphoesterase [Alphaproteobacteria bacterium]|nr:metallophosphoesterase [Alphaproteobacteria bacterium]